MKYAWLAGVLIAVVGCGGGDDGDDGDDTAADPAVRIDDEPPGTNCPGGGSAVHVGADTDGDGTLDDAEIDSTTYVCDPAALIRVDAEPAGANCAAGGRAVHSGLDADGDGALGDPEIADTIYVCDDAVAAVVTRVAPEPAGDHCANGGIAVSSGLDLDVDSVLDDGEVTHVDYVCDDVVVSSVAVEPPGPNCVSGGAAVSSGVDADGDGELAASEIASTEYVCGGVHVGDLNPWSLTVEERAQVVVVTGDLRLTSAFVTSVSMPALRAVGGMLEIYGNEDLVTFDAPLLAAVGEDVMVLGNPELTTVDLGGLVMTDSIHMFLNDVLDVVDLGSLIEVPTTLTIEDPIASLDLHSLKKVGELSLSNLQVPVLSMPLLHWAWSVNLSNSTTTAIELPALRMCFSGIAIFANADLAALALPLLHHVGGNLSVIGNAALESLALPMLTRLESLSLGLTPSLTSLAGLSALVEVTGMVSLQGDLGVMDLSELTGLRRLTGEVTITGTNLTRLGVPNLRDVEELDVGSNLGMTALDLPGLRTAGMLAFHDNPAATGLGLPALIGVWDQLRATALPLAPRCEIDAVVDGLAAAPPVIAIAGVDDDGVCD